jgi:MFS family permease
MINNPFLPTDHAGSGASSEKRGGSVAGDHHSKRLRYLIYALVMLSSVLQQAIAPLLSTYAHRFQLDGLETAELLAATAVAALLVSMPAGSLSDRFGARVVTLWAGWLMALGTGAQAFAPSFGFLLATRLVFGLGYGIMWTSALAWLGNTSGDRSTLAGTVTASGVGCIVGPSFAGFLAQYFGLAAPFVISAVLCAAVTLMLSGIAVEGVTLVETAGAVTTLRAVVADRKILGASVAAAVAGAVAAITTLLASLELHDAGAGEGSIGLMFSAAAVLYIVGSATMDHIGHHAVRLKTVLGAGLVLVLTLLPTTLSAAPLFVLVMLCATSVGRSVLWAVAYPLAEDGANAAGLGLGVVMGFLNSVWAFSAFIAPLLAGGLVGSIGLRGTYGLTQIVIGGGLLIGWSAFRARVPLGGVEVEGL